MDEMTSRERIYEMLCRESLDAEEIAERLEVSEDAVYGDLRHVRRSLSGCDETLMASPPECGKCGFDGFDDLINRPSRCPECNSLDIKPPAFTIRS